MEMDSSSEELRRVGVGGAFDVSHGVQWIADDLDGFGGPENAIALACIITLSIIFVVNVALLVLMLRDPIVRSQRSIVLLFNVGFADLALGLTLVPTHIINVSGGRFMPGPVVCGWIGMNAVMWCQTSVAAITLIAIERWLLVVKRYPISAERLAQLVGLSWLYSALTALAPVYAGLGRYVLQPSRAMCNLGWWERAPDQLALVSIVVFVSLGFPLAINFYCYWQLFHHVKTNSYKKPGAAVVPAPPAAAKAPAAAAKTPQNKLVAPPLLAPTPTAAASSDPKVTVTISTPPLAPVIVPVACGSPVAAASGTVTPIVELTAKPPNPTPKAGGGTGSGASAAITTIRIVPPSPTAATTTTTPTTAAAAAAAGRKADSSEAAADRREAAIGRKMLVLCLCFAVSWFPYFIKMLWEVISGRPCLYWFDSLAIWMAGTNSLVNPLVLLYVNDRIREIVRMWVLGLPCSRINCCRRTCCGDDGGCCGIGTNRLQRSNTVSGGVSGTVVAAGAPRSQRSAAVPTPTAPPA